MIELVFIACLRLSPDLCEERSIAHLEVASLDGCIAQAPPQLLGRVLAAAITLARRRTLDRPPAVQGA